MTGINLVGQTVAIPGRASSGRITTVVMTGDKYRDWRRSSPEESHPVYFGQSFAVVVDDRNRSHHVLLDDLA